jgi:hypothetical protein
MAGAAEGRRLCDGVRIRYYLLHAEECTHNFAMEKTGSTAEKMETSAVRMETIDSMAEKSAVLTETVREREQYSTLC